MDFVRESHRRQRINEIKIICIEHAPFYSLVPKEADNRLSVSLNLNRIRAVCTWNSINPESVDVTPTKLPKVYFSLARFNDN